MILMHLVYSSTEKKVCGGFVFLNLNDLFTNLFTNVILNLVGKYIGKKVGKSMSLTDKIIELCSYDDEQEWF